MSDTFLWMTLGFIASLMTTAIPLIQEKFKADAFSISYLIKVVLVVMTAPLVFHFGLPSNPEFYYMTAISAAIWCINDILYFRAIPVVGSGVVSRILPASVILSFVLWFFFDPTLLDKYLSSPIQSLFILGIVIASAFFSIALKSCPVTLQGIKMIWFVILAAAIGTLSDKLALNAAPAEQLPFAYAFTLGVLMLAFWTVYGLLNKKFNKAIFLNATSLKCGGLIGVVAGLRLYIKFWALQLCENPALLSVILFTDALWIIIYYRLTGRKDDSKIWAGLGIVGCAAALVLVKSL